MPIDSTGTAPAEESDPQPGAAQRRIVLSFCATVLLGVLLCAGYLASAKSKIAVHPAPKSAALVAPAVVLPAVAPPPQPVAPVETPMPVRAERKPAVPGATYLQMAAVDRGVAEVYMEVLHRKGFQATIAKGPTEDIFRVLVGPVKDAADLARVKADLQASGFSSFPRKLTSE